MGFFKSWWKLLFLQTFSSNGTIIEFRMNSIFIEISRKTKTRTP
jgi:hypothetical protein